MSASRELADLVSESPSTDLNLDNNTLFVDVSENRVGIGTTTPESKLDIKVGSAGSVTPWSESDDLVLESNTVAGISILTPDDSSARLVFGSPSSNQGAALFYRQNLNKMNVGTLQSGGALALRSGADVDALYIDGNQNVLIGGSTTAETIVAGTPTVQVEGLGYADSSISIFSNSNDTSGSYLFIGKSRGSSLSSDTIVQDGDFVGGIEWVAADGTDRASRIAGIYGVVDGTPGEDDTPGELTFYTTADGANSGTQKMVIKADGKVGIGTSAPGQLLHIRGTSNPGIAISESASITSNSRGDFAVYNSADSTVGLMRFGAETDNVGTHLAIFTRPASGSLAEVMRIDTTGNVGIGTSSPEQEMHIKVGDGGSISSPAGLEGAVIRLEHDQEWESGYGTSGGDFLGGLEFASGDTSTGVGVRAAIKTTVDNYYNTNSLTFYTAPSNVSGIVERVRIDSSGNVGINRTDPHYQVHVGGNSKNIGMQQGYMTGTTVTLTDASAFDCLFFRRSDGTAISSAIAGHVYLTALQGANITSKVYVLTTTSNGVTDASIHEVTNGSQVRNTLTINTPTIVADGTTGGIKLRITRNVSANVSVNTLFVGVHATT